MVLLPAGSIISAEDFLSSVRVTIGFLVISLTKALLVRLLSLARRPTQGIVVVVPNFFHFIIIEATVLLGNFRNIRALIYALPQFYRRGLHRVPWTSWVDICPDMQCELRDLCTYRNDWTYDYVQSIKLATFGLWSHSRHISRIIRASKMHLTTIWSATAKGLNTLEILIHLQKCPNTVFTLSLWVIQCRMTGKKCIFISFKFNLQHN